MACAVQRGAAPLVVACPQIGFFMVHSKNAVLGILLLTGAAVVLGAGTAARAELITITIHNARPAGGGVLSPTLFTVHDGSYTQFTPGAAASLGVERTAEDGNATFARDAALQSPAVFASERVAGTPLVPGDTRTLTFDLDPANPRATYLSFLSMFVPSNDAFIGNPTNGFRLFDAGGNLIRREGATTIRILGSQIWDAGTEVNDEIPGNALGLGVPSLPNQGTTENGVVRLHQGFIGSQGLGGSLGTILTAAPFADFTSNPSEFIVAEITIVPAPGVGAAVGLASLTALIRRRRR